MMIHIYDTYNNLIAEHVADTTLYWWTACGAWLLPFHLRTPWARMRSCAVLVPLNINLFNSRRTEGSR